MCSPLIGEGRKRKVQQVKRRRLPGETNSRHGDGGSRCGGRRWRTFIDMTSIPSPKNWGFGLYRLSPPKNFRPIYYCGKCRRLLAMSHVSLMGQSPPMWHCLCLLWLPSKQLSVLRLPHHTMQKILSVEVVQNKKNKEFLQDRFSIFFLTVEKTLLCPISFQWEF